MKNNLDKIDEVMHGLEPEIRAVIEKMHELCRPNSDLLASCILSFSMALACSVLSEAKSGLDPFITKLMENVHGN